MKVLLVNGGPHPKGCTNRALEEVEKALKEEGYEKIDEEYEDLIKFFRNQSVKDPTDLAAVSFRVQCYIDVKDFDNAEKLCSLLSDELKNPLLEEINKTKTGGTE